jgi:23S rRNA (cytosine1962-C5)-methyltransferase
LLVNHIAAGFPSRGGQARPSTVLNVFAYTCGFSVCAAKAGSHITSLDLSRKALDWGRRNFELNGLPHRDHEFVYGDAFDWLRRFAKKKRRFDTILLDPPTFSTSKRGGPFRAEADLGVLIQAALPLLKPDGVLFVSTNAARLAPEEFLQCIHTGIARSGRQLARQHYVPQPPDFPISRTEPAYLKTCWLQVTV